MNLQCNDCGYIITQSADPTLNLCPHGCDAGMLPIAPDDEDLENENTP